MDEEFRHLPGAELVLPGIADLAAGRITDEAILVAIGSPRLRLCGIALPAIRCENPEAELFGRLQARYGDDAHSRYNALIRITLNPQAKNTKL